MDEKNILKTSMLSYRKTTEFLRIYYIVGAIGFLLPYTRPLFVFLTPYGLLFNLALILYFETQKRDSADLRRIIGYSAFIYLATFLLEYVGVNTGVLFGKYSYQEGLGIKLGGTPLLIGVNWIIVFMGASRITQKIDSKWNRIFYTAVIMFLFDLLMEQVAPFMHMWEFSSDTVPLQNYLMWFVIGLLLQIGKEFLKINFQTGMSSTIFRLQFLFFLVLFLASLLNQTLT